MIKSLQNSLCGCLSEKNYIKFEASISRELLLMLLFLFGSTHCNVSHVTFAGKLADYFGIHPWNRSNDCVRVQNDKENYDNKMFRKKKERKKTTGKSQWLTHVAEKKRNASERLFRKQKGQEQMEPVTISLTAINHAVFARYQNIQINVVWQSYGKILAAIAGLVSIHDPFFARQYPEPQSRRSHKTDAHTLPFTRSHARISKA